MNEWKNVCKILLYVNVKSQASKKQAIRKKETNFGLVIPSSVMITIWLMMQCKCSVGTNAYVNSYSMFDTN